MKFTINQEETAFSLVLAGDICPGQDGEAVAAAGQGDQVLAPVADFIRSADLRLMQWETPVAACPAPIVKCGPNLNAAESTIDIFTSGGFNIAMLANNHTGDQGPAAVLETMDCLQRHGLQTVGAGSDLQSARKPLITRAGGLSIAIFNFAENEFGGATRTQPGSAPQDEYADAAEVRAASQKYDMVIVTLHGGHETNPFPSPRIIGKCRGLVDAGAKLVFNCHTHCPQGIEIYRNSPIVYCPGNFYFPQHYSGSLWYQGYLTRCSFGKTGAASLEILPYEFNSERVAPLPPDRELKFDQYMSALCAPLSDADEMQRLFEGWSAVFGKEHYELLVNALSDPCWQDKLNDREILQKVMLHRNLFTCESHRDIIRCYLKLAEERRLKEAEQKFTVIAKLQKGF